ncbi:MAG: glycosyltransferase [Acidobacteria bacterium]|nr:glycosyltransferase [Acidobacteriota bacterium]MBI3658603.1 glycosyltransferase [Acidobacteriota bacterium]
MIKIVHLITDLAVGGAEMMLYKLLRGMERRRFQNVVVSMASGGSLADKITALDIPVYSLDLRRGAPNPAALWRLRRVLRQVKPHVLQTWLYHADLLGLVAGKWAGVPALAWNVRCSEMDLRRYSRLTSYVVRILSRLSALPDVVMVNSEAGRRFHEALGYHPRCWQLIPNGFDLEQFRPDAAARISFRREIGIPEESLLIGLLARFDPMKDHDNFLKAAGLLRKRQPDVHFVMAGRGVDLNNSILNRSIRDQALEGRVHRLGERSDVATILAAMDITTSTSYGEGFPNVIGEAMACGVPCVVTDTGDCAQIVADSGRVVPPKQPQAFVAAWNELIEMGPSGRNALGQRARRRIEEHFNLPVIVSKYEAVYSSLFTQ